MGAYLSTPISDKVSEDKQLKNFAYGASSMQGWRVAQEDSHNCCPNFDESRGLSLFAVYDGHGGAEVAQYTAMHFPKFLKAHQVYKKGQLATALEEGFLAFDEQLATDEVVAELKRIAGTEPDEDEERDEGEAAALAEEAEMSLVDLMARYGGAKGAQGAAVRQQENYLSPALRPKKKTGIEKMLDDYQSRKIGVDEEDEEEGDELMTGGEEPGADSGCTAVVALLKQGQLIVANAGDSRCVVSRAGKALDMSVDHKPEDALESSRIRGAGGRITMDGRVNGGLNLSRALGDHVYKQNTALPAQEQMISSQPDVKTLNLTTADQFMVLACDGIWNVMTSQGVVDFVGTRIKKHTKLSKICEEMFDHCMAPDTSGDGTGCDNMTCIIVTLDKLGNLKRSGSAGADEVVSATTTAASRSPPSKRAKVNNNRNNNTSDNTETVEVESAVDGLKQETSDEVDEECRHS